MSETAAAFAVSWWMAFAVSWWMVRAALTEASILTLPDVDELSPRMLGIDEHRFRSVRFFRDPGSGSWIRHEPWMTTIVDLDTGQVLGVVDGRDHKGVGDWLFARPLEWRLGIQVVAIDPSAAFPKACGCGFHGPPLPLSKLGLANILRTFTGRIGRAGNETEA